MEILVSIVVPVYNVAEYLPACVNSILSQTHRNIEVILVNDGSTDDSLQICKCFSSENARVVVVDKANGGVSSARNAGLKVARGDVIGFVDADDWVESDMIGRLLAEMTQGDAEICVSRSYWRGGSIFRVAREKGGVLTCEQAVEALVGYRLPSSLCMCLYHASVVKKLRLREDIHHFEDFEFQARAFLSSKRITVCDRPLYHYRERFGSANNTGFNWKTATCLKIPDAIRSTPGADRVIDETLFAAMTSRFVVAVATSMVRSKCLKNELVPALVALARGAVLKVLKSDSPLQVKEYIVLLSISYSAFYGLYGTCILLKEKIAVCWE